MTGICGGLQDELLGESLVVLERFYQHDVESSATPGNCSRCIRVCQPGMSPMPFSCNGFGISPPPAHGPTLAFSYQGTTAFGVSSVARLCARLLDTRRLMLGLPQGGDSDCSSPAIWLWNKHFERALCSKVRQSRKALFLLFLG